MLVVLKGCGYLPPFEVALTSICVVGALTSSVFTDHHSSITDFLRGGGTHLHLWGGGGGGGLTSSVFII